MGKGGISPDYFLDRMTMQEAKAIYDAVQEQYQDSLNQTRYIAFIQAWSHGAKLSKPTDLVKFSWDVVEEPEELTPEQLIQTQYDLIDAFNSPDKKEFRPF